MPRQIPTTPDALTPDWLSETLRASGTIAARVSSAHLTQIGKDEGFTGGRLYHIALTYDPPDPTAPATLVAKLAPDDAKTRALMRAANGCEVDFYQSQSQATLPVPRCHHADFNPETGTSILLLQDLSDHRPLDFIKGCGPADAKMVVKALAALHATWWNAPDLHRLRGASMLGEHPFDQVWPQYPEKLHALLHGVEMPPSFMALGNFIAQNHRAIFTRLQETAPVTRLHRDVQADNVMFANPDCGGGAILFDWQFAGKGRAVQDVGYFLISSVDPAQRRTTERGLVAQYHAELLRLGVTGYGLAQCWTDYLQSVAAKFYMTVAATVLLDNSTPHKQAWRRADLARLQAFCADHRISEDTFAVPT